ncbi:HDOD domain-containing protein [Alteromonas aestuariivivens]|uniref:HDOD domain-containing protein n=1 Tax=Alteromonas aestuariivivens TaxID=1938339 RepID=A0A3D8MGT7_9ALTE|nr:HDOD domain-containing protein [Alteromonas aestuariivivens]RDV29418.1 HDOD domain-containing protein [Alteromonas aestuariivivens]
MSVEKYVSFAAQSFTLPDLCLRIRNVLDDHRSDTDDIARMISVDPSLSAKILRLANSALFRFPSQIESIPKAINVIGGEALYNLVIAETANSAFKCFESGLIRLDKHWHSSVYCGMAGKYLAKQSRVRASERFFVMGILMNLSELVIAKCSPDEYQAYLSDEHPGLPWEKQKKYFNFTFAECSGTIMESWKLPLPLFFPVKNAHNPHKQAAERDIALIACAQRITLRENEPQEYGKLELFTPEIAASLKVEGETLGNAVSFANTETQKIVNLIR